MGKLAILNGELSFQNVSAQVQKKAPRTNLSNQLATETPTSKGQSRHMETLRELQMICLQTPNHRAFILKDPTQTSCAGSPVA